MISSKIFSGFGIKATGVAFPETGGEWISNNLIHQSKFGVDWERTMSGKNLDPQYQEKKYGFASRYWVTNPFKISPQNALTSYDLLYEAAGNVLAASGINKSDIGFLITFTSTSPYYTSSTATRVAGGLGLNCPAIEIKAGCSSGLYAMVLAYQLLSSGCQNVLIAGADTMSKVIDPASTLIYAGGDGGAALIIGNVSEYNRGLFASYLESDGKYADLMHMQGTLPPNEDDLIGKEFKLQYDSGMNPILEAKWEKIPEILFSLTSIKREKLDFYIPHHVNLELMEKGRIAAEFTSEQTGNYITEIANIGACGIYYGLHRSFQEKRIKEGDHVMLAAVGGGLNWGGLVVSI